MPRHADQIEPTVTEITGLDSNGLGIAESAGKVLAIHGALPGESVSIRTFGGRRGNKRAELIEVQRKSDYRVVPRCPHFGICGACKLQHLQHDEQLVFKQAQLLENLAQIGTVEAGRILPPLVGPLWNYRRKARLSVRWVEKKGRVLVGFRELNGRYVADIDQCHILDERIAGCLPQLAELVAGLAIFDRIPQLEVACGDQLAALIFRVLEPVSDRDAESLRTFAQNSGIAIFLQPGGPATITPLEPARVQLEYQIPAHSVRFEFGPANFVQVNAGLNQLMVDQVIKMLEPTASDRVVDLFCGIGNFSLPLARYAGSVLGLEGDSDLVDLARHNAGLNSMTNVHFDVADLAAARLTLPPDFASATKVLLDPPRSGAAGVIPAIAAGDANRLVYVSCNPVTLAEDAGQLVNTYGYRLEAAGIMDMFPHTAHIESCALFTR